MWRVADGRRLTSSAACPAAGDNGGTEYWSELGPADVQLHPAGLGGFFRVSPARECISNIVIPFGSLT